MGINNYGNAGQPLNSPPLGGPGGWAEAVAAALNNDDTTVNDRIAAGDADKEDKAGDTMTGGLTAPQLTAAGPTQGDAYVQSSEHSLWLMARDSDHKAFIVSSTPDNLTKGPLQIQATSVELVQGAENPTADGHVASKGYVDSQATPYDSTMRGVEHNAGWTGYGGSWGGYGGYVTRTGTVVTMHGLFKRTGANMSFSTGIPYVMGYVPVGYVPSIDVMTIGVFTHSAGSNSFVRVDVEAATRGIRFTPNFAGTMQTNGWVGYSFSWHSPV